MHNEEKKNEIEKLKSDCLALEEQVKLLVKIENQLRRTQAELIESKERINEYNRTLEQKVKDRTKELEKLNAELISFVYIVSHDLQEPLRKVSIFGDRLKLKYSSMLDKQGKDYIERMQKSSRRMQSLINDLLDYSRVTTQSEPFTQVNLNNIVKNVLYDLEVLIEKTNAKVKIEKLPVVSAISIQMHHLFQNLISNAIKFHKPDIIPIIKIYEKKIEKNNFYTIIVEDNGIGIDKDYYDKIFGVFKRLHSKDQYEGSGIGLAICKKIVDRHGGNIYISSEKGKGSTFSISLPKK
jgi:light-regulated signal transduction histidine kinase (bacteriophytochrome)